MIQAVFSNQRSSSADQSLGSASLRTSTLEAASMGDVGTEAAETGTTNNELFHEHLLQIRNQKIQDLEEEDLTDRDTMTAQESLEYLRAKNEEMKKKLLNGEIEEKYQIGASELTNGEWDKLVERVDKIVDDVKEKVKDEMEQRKENEDKKLLLKKHEKEEEMITGEKNPIID